MKILVLALILVLGVVFILGALAGVDIGRCELTDNTGKVKESRGKYYLVIEKTEKDYKLQKIKDKEAEINNIKKEMK